MDFHRSWWKGGTWAMEETWVVILEFFGNRIQWSVCCNLPMIDHITQQFAEAAGDVCACVCVCIV